MTLTNDYKHLKKKYDLLMSEEEPSKALLCDLINIMLGLPDEFRGQSCKNFQLNKLETYYLEKMQEYKPIEIIQQKLEL